MIQDTLSGPILSVIRKLGPRRAAPARWLMAVLAMVALSGCEVDTFLDPSGGGMPGRFERTPVQMPILDQLDIIDEPPSRVAGLSQVQPEDLISVFAEYVIGTGDLVTVTVYELQNPGQDWGQTRLVDELGFLRLPILGPIKADGFTPSQLEREIARVVESRQLLREPSVSVIVQQGRQRTYSVIGEAQVAGTAIGTYSIPHPDFRLLEAMAMARGVSGQIKRLYIIRQVQLEKPGVVPTPGVRDPSQPAPTTPVPENPADLIENLMQGLDEPPTPAPPTPAQPAGPEAPPGLHRGLDEEPPPQWINVNGKWVRAPGSSGTPGAVTPATQPAPTSAQRIIEVPYDELLEGNMQYNVVIRPGDIIRVPAPVAGNVYIGGQISRPGTYFLPGDGDLNLKQLIISAGGLTGLAIPERVDLIRRVGDSQEVTVRINFRDITNGRAPDFFLKPNDTINIGTSFIATPLAVFRNGFRASYGFGFILDRNFEQDVFQDVSN